MSPFQSGQLILASSVSQGGVNTLDLSDFSIRVILEFGDRISVFDSFFFSLREV